MDGQSVFWTIAVQKVGRILQDIDVLISRIDRFKSQLAKGGPDVQAIRLCIEQFELEKEEKLKEYQKLEKDLGSQYLKYFLSHDV